MQSIIYTLAISSHPFSMLFCQYFLLSVNLFFRLLRSEKCHRVSVKSTRLLEASPLQISTRNVKLTRYFERYLVGFILRYFWRHVQNVL